MVRYYLGTRGFTKKWENPASIGEVKIICKSLQVDSEPANSIVGRKAVRCVSLPEPYQHFGVNFGDKVCLLN